MPIELATPRLQLVAATLEMARAELEDRGELSRLLDARLPANWPPPLNDDDSARFFLTYLSEHPSDAGWVMWYFIRTVDGDRVAIGNGGFTGAPAGGTVEVGYSIVPEFQRQGYASEAVGALLDWAFSHDVVERAIAQTLPDLHASAALLRKLGFTEVPPVKEGVLRFELARDSGATT